MGRPSKRAAKVRESSEFDIARLRAQLGFPKDLTITTASWSLEEIFAARADQLRGNFKRPAAMAASMRTDDALFVAWANRLAPQRCVQVAIEAASDKGKALSVAKEAEGSFGQEGVGIAPGALVDINGCLVDHGVAFGVNDTTAREDGSRIDFLHRYWPIEFVRWDDTLKMFVTRVDPETVQAGDKLQQNPALGYAGAYEIPITHGDGRWVVYSSFQDQPFRKEAAILSACVVWARHAFAIRDWSKGSVAHGNAKFVGTMPEGVPLQDDEGVTPEAGQFALLLQDLSREDTPIGIKPFGSEIDFITNTSTAWQVWKELVGDGKQAAARIYLGTDGTLGTTGGAPGVDISELFGVAVTKVKGDLECIERGLRTGVIEPWAAVNFGDSTLAPTRRYMLPDADEEAWRAAVAQRRSAFNAEISAMRANGFVVDQDVVDTLAKEFDITAPKLVPPPEPAPGMAPAA